MAHFVKKLVFVGILCLVFCKDVAAATFPTSVRFHFGEDAKVVLSVSIARYRVYYLDLVFIYSNEEERAHVRRVAGGNANGCSRMNDCGEVSSFDIKIKRDGSLLYQATKRVFGTYAHGRSYLRNILKYPLPPGIYDVEVTPIEFGPAIKNLNTEILFTTDPRSADLRE